MLDVNIERLSEVAVVQCKGRVVQSDDVFKLRDFVMAQEGVRLIALDLSEVDAIGGGGLGMLAYLQNWAGKHEIGLYLVSPSSAVMDELGRTSGIDFNITSPIDLMSTEQQGCGRAV